MPGSILSTSRVLSPLILTQTHGFPPLQARKLRLKSFDHCPKVTQGWVLHYLSLREKRLSSWKVLASTLAKMLFRTVFCTFQQAPGSLTEHVWGRATKRWRCSMSQSGSGKVTVVDTEQLLTTVSLYLQSQRHRPHV